MSGLSPLAWLVRLLVVLFVAAALWKGATLAWQALEHWRFARPTLTAAPPSTPHAPVLDPELQRAVEQAAAGGGGSVAVYVWDLNSGASAALDADSSIPAASLFKLPVLVEVLKQERLGRITPDQKFTIRPEHWADGAGVLQSHIGESYTVADLSEIMIAQSDNTAARVLMDAVGVDSINQTMGALGLSHTHIAPLEAEQGKERPDHTTSAHDMGALLGLIAQGGLVDAQTSEQALRLLEAKQEYFWLDDGLPWWAKVAHKWGDLPGFRHDAGIVYTPRGRYAIAVLTRNKAPGDAADTIGRVSRAVFERLGSDPQ
jgi:beta-lactamase class A